MASGIRIALVGTGVAPTRAELLAHPGLAGADTVISSRAILDILGETAAQTIAVKTPVSALLDQAAALLDQGKFLAVLTSGDPLFYSLGVSFAERFGAEAVRVYPGITSLQAAAAAFAIPWESVVAVSAHGRKGFLPLAHAAMQGAPVCLLTDAVNTPGAAARFLLERGLTNFAAHVAVNLGRTDASLWQGSLAESQEKTFPDPNVVFFMPDETLPAPHPLCPGNPESAFAHEGGLITKWPVRAAAIAALRIEPGHVVWDLGSGSGSVAVEAAALARRGHVIAVEREAGRIRHIAENRRRFGAANLDILHAAMPHCLEESYPTTANGAALSNGFPPRPDRIFIGGGLGGGREDARSLIRLAWQRLLPRGRMVVSCVLLEDFALARETIAALDRAAETTLVQAASASSLGTGTHLRGLNPVFLIAAQKNE